MFHDRSLLRRCFWGFVLPVFEYCSAVWCSVANTHLKLLDCAVSGAWFLTGVCLSVTLLIVAVLCTLHKIRCNPVNPLNGALLGPYVKVRIYKQCSGLTSIHLCATSLRLAAAPCSTAGLLFSSRCPSGTILLTPYSMVWDWRVSRAGPMHFCWPKLLYPYNSLLLYFLFSSVCQ